MIINCFEREEIRFTKEGSESDEPTKEDALAAVFSVLQPGEPITVEAAEKDLESMFFKSTRYDLGRVGRYKLNSKFNYKEPVKEHTLVKQDIIATMNIEGCGPKVIEQIEKYFLTGNADFTHLNRDAYYWIEFTDSSEYLEMMDIMNTLNKSFDDFKSVITENSVNTVKQIPVILTGEPNDYKSKGEFLKCNPQYRLTGSWKEVQIVFTNSLESNTGKMKKAREKNIEIRLY